MTSADELKMLFEMSYMPVAHVMQRYNGKDFIGVVVPLLDSIREQTSDPNRIKEAAQMFVYCFNEKLDPKLSFSDLNDMVSLLVNNGPMVRQAAKEALEEFNQTLARRKRGF